jgi:hypothetical protein
MGQPLLDQEVEGTVDGDGSYPTPLGCQNIGKVISPERLGGAKKHLEDTTADRRQPYALDPAQSLGLRQGLPGAGSLGPLEASIVAGKGVLQGRSVDHRDPSSNKAESDTAPHLQIR